MSLQMIYKSDIIHWKPSHFTQEEMIVNLQWRVDFAGSLRKFCELYDFDAGDVSRMLHGKMPISKRIAALMGYEPVRTWKRIEEEEKK